MSIESVLIGVLNRFRRSSRFRLLWRARNVHNFTKLDLIPENELFFDQVEVGRLSYGPIWAAWSGNPDERLRIGSFCSIGSGVKFIMGSEHKHSCLSTYPFKVKIRGDEFEATTKGIICVKDDVWIGEDALILSGVTIGQGAVIAARAVVVKDVPAYSIVGGNPAQIIKYRFSSAICARLLKINFGNLRLDDENRLLSLMYRDISENNVDEIVAEFETCC